MLSKVSKTRRCAKGLEDHISDVEEVAVVEYDPEVAMAEINAEQMMAESFAEEASLVGEAKYVTVTVALYC